MGVGRPKGSTDKKNNAIKDMIIASLDEIGGKDYFIQQATENPAAYMGLIGKILPRDMTVEIFRTAWDAIDEQENADGNSTEAKV